jgi:hypothetical protein
MRRIYGCVTCILILACTTAAASDARSSRRMATRCPRRQSHVLAVDAKANVYQTARGVFGCAYGHDHSYSLAPPGFLPGLSNPKQVNIKRLAGPIVAIELYEYRSEIKPLIIVSDLRTGRVIHTVRTGANYCNISGFCRELATPLVLEEDGSAAWVVSQTNRTGNTQTEIISVDSTGSHVVAFGRTYEGIVIDPQSLALTGSTLHWMQNGELMSATLD